MTYEEIGRRLMEHAERVKEWKEGLEYEREARAIANSPEQDDEPIDMG